MRTSERKISVTTEMGTVLDMTVVVNRGYEPSTEISYCDGDNVQVITTREINKNTITITTGGKSYTGTFDNFDWSPNCNRIRSEKGVYAVFASKIGLSEAIYNQLISVVNEAKAEAETDSNWLTLQAKKASAEIAENEYYQHTANVENMMTLNGRTY